MDLQTSTLIFGLPIHRTSDSISAGLRQLHYACDLYPALEVYDFRSVQYDVNMLLYNCVVYLMVFYYISQKYNIFYYCNCKT